MEPEFEFILSYVSKIDVVNPYKTMAGIERKLLKINEEMGEVMEAYLNVTSKHNQKNKTWDEVLEELIDVSIIVVDVGLSISSAKIFSEHAWVMNVGITSSNPYHNLIKSHAKILDAYDNMDGSEHSNIMLMWACTKMYKELLILINDVAIEQNKVMSILDQKLAKWTANMAIMPTSEIDDEV